MFFCGACLGFCYCWRYAKQRRTIVRKSQAWGDDPDGDQIVMTEIVHEKVHHHHYHERVYLAKGGLEHVADAKDKETIEVITSRGGGGGGGGGDAALGDGAKNNEVLKEWFTYHLAAAGSPLGKVTSFGGPPNGGDFQDGKVLATVMRQVLPQLCDAGEYVSGGCCYWFGLNSWQPSSLLFTTETWQPPSHTETDGKLHNRNMKHET